MVYPTLHLYCTVQYFQVCSVKIISLGYALLVLLNLFSRSQRLRPEIPEYILKIETFREIVFACSYGAQVEFLKGVENHVRK